MSHASNRPVIFVSVDMEGCADVVHWDEVRPSTSAEYARSREIVTAEVNAVICGAFEGGATAVTVNDSHSTMRNLLIERLDPRATVISGRLKPNFMLEGIGPEFTAAYFVAYHGAIGAADAVMGHTYSPRVIFECRLNGSPIGELTINAAMAGAYGVPVTLVSGDQTTLVEAATTVPWAHMVETKKSMSYFAAESISPAAACAALRESARLACSCAGARPFALTAPVAMEIDTYTTAQADHLELIPNIRRMGARCIRFESDDVRAIYLTLQAVIYLGAAATA